MTAQINDTCLHRKIDFAVAGISGSGLFDPPTVGIQPVSMSTACWRGYVAHYSILDGELFLTSLHIGLPQNDAIRARARKGPELFGVLPAADQFSGFFYEGFQSRVPFTGEVVDGNGHANNVAYVQWMQDAAIGHAKACGGERLARELGASWFVRLHRIEYLKPRS